MAKAFSSSLCVVAACLLSLALTNSGLAAEPTEPERMQEQLAETEEPANKLLAARWKALVRQRQWADKSGKHKVYARYVDHDADLKSVTLLIYTRAGGQDSYKEKTIPLALLGKNEQALVKRIDIARKQVEAALAKAPAGEGGTTEESPAEGRGSDPYGREGGEGEIVGAEDAAQIEVSAVSPPVMITPGAVGEQIPAAMSQNAAWRTDFNAFASQVSAQQDSDGKWTITWGELQQFEPAAQISRMFAEALKGPRQPGSPSLVQLAFGASSALLQLGEVTWETTLAAPITAGQPISHDLQLPAPLSLVLLPEERKAGDVTRLNAGDRVRFIGRFADLGGAGEQPVITLRVRFPEEQPAPAGDEAGENYRGEGVYPPERPSLGE